MTDREVLLKTACTCYCSAYGELENGRLWNASGLKRCADEALQQALKEDTEADDAHNSLPKPPSETLSKEPRTSCDLSARKTTTHQAVKQESLVSSIDRFISEHPQFDGIEFLYDKQGMASPRTCTCILWSKDRTHPVRVTVHSDSSPKCDESRDDQVLTHMAKVRAAKLAFGWRAS
jgi:hypothetical protein